MSGRLAGEHVLVTGGARGIGAAVVDKALAEGAKVSFLDIDEAAGHARAAAIASDDLAFAAADIRSSKAIEAGLRSVSGRLGPVTALVNNAGLDSYGDPVSMTEAAWDNVFSVDLKAAWLVARAVLPAMIEARRGSIVNIASIHADMTYPGAFPYAAAKSGLVGLTRSMALDVGRHGIRVNALSPGYVETALNVEFFARAEPGLRDRVVGVHALGRLGQPFEIANCVVFLLSHEASFVTGANWLVDGGLSARFAG